MRSANAHLSNECGEVEGVEALAKDSQEDRPLLDGIDGNHDLTSFLAGDSTRTRWTLKASDSELQAQSPEPEA